MTSFSERVAELRVTASTPNEQVSGEIRGDEVSVTIAHGYAERVGETELEQQLQRLARLLFAQRSHAYNRIVQDLLQPSASPHRREEDRAFYEDYEAMTVSETSYDGAVTVTQVGLEHWSVSIQRGTVARGGGQHIARAVAEAATALIEETISTVRALNAKHFPLPQAVPS